MEEKEIITRIKFVFKDCPNQDLVNESIMYYTEVIKMDERFYRNVADKMPELLPKPTRKPLKDSDGRIIQIISITCEGVEW